MNRRIAGSAAALAAAILSLTLLAGCSSAGSGVPDPTNLPAETTQTSVFYSTGRSLVEEPKVVDASNVYAATLAELLKAEPQLNQDIAIVQPTAKVKSVTFENGNLNVDWAADVLKFDATDKEKLLAWASILETMGQFPEVKTVTFSVEGKTTGTVGGNDVQAFWKKISLKKQPWPALRPPAPSEAASGTAAPLE